MADPFVGEIRLFGFDFAPRDWAACDGQLMDVNQNSTLYSLLGTTYGGNGTSNFKLPDYRGRVPLHFGASTLRGQASGSEAVSLTPDCMPSHSHSVNVAGGSADTPGPSDSATFADTGSLAMYGPAGTTNDMAIDMVGSAGGNHSHNNMQPYLALNFCIALAGLYPSRP